MESPLSLYETGDAINLPVEPTSGATPQTTPEGFNAGVHDYKPPDGSASPFFLSERYHGDIQRAATPSSSDEGEPGTSKYDYYQLRKEFSSRLVETAEADRDDSGNYDPSKERAEQRAALRKRRLGQKNAANSHGRRRSKHDQLQQPSPEDALHGPEKPANDILQTQGSISSDMPALIQPTRLRSGNGRSHPIQHSVAEDTVSEHAVIVDCKQCFNSGIPCIPSTPNAWPCEGCRDIGAACELRSGSQKKQQCEACRKLKLRCEFQDGKEHPGPCKQCRMFNAQCVAAPRLNPPKSIQRLNESTKKRYAEEVDLDNQSCHECKVANAKCSLKEKTGFFKCNRCKKLALPCGASTVTKRVKRDEPSPVQANKLQASAQSRQAFDASISECINEHDSGTDSNATSDQPNSTSLTRPEPADTSKEQLLWSTSAGQDQIRIKTRLSHPVMLTEDCSWCQDLFYGLVGIKERSVTVVVLPDVGGFKEVAGDPLPRGTKPRGMCLSCANLRCNVLACAEHEFKQIADPLTFDDDQIHEYLQPSIAGKAPFEWCSVCLSAAFYACTTPPDELPNAEGCGLKLCEDCFMMLEKDYDGDFVTMIEVRMMDDEDLADMRADVELFTSNQFLERFGSLSED